MDQVRFALSYFVETYLPGGRKMNVLNHSIIPSDNEQSTSASAIDIAASLQLMILKLKGKYLSDDGKTVDYAGLKADDIFKEFENLSNQLAHVELANLSSMERKAFFINVYNTLTIHGLCRCEPLPKSVMELNHFWQRTAYNINGLTFSLDDIEHGILRGNKRHPAGITRPFSDSDPRVKYSMEQLDPRIHCALNCGAKSCPAIAVYKENNLDQSLTNAATNFISDSVYLTGKDIHLSKIFQWYRSDFGTNDMELLRWISQFLTAARKDEIDRVIASDQFNIVYDEYDWLVNAK